MLGPMITPRKISLIMLFLASLALALPGFVVPAMAQEENFMEDLDLPLFPGTSEVEEERVVFDSPGGRIIKAMATGPVSAQAAYDYYRVVVPSLGWDVSEQPVPEEQCEETAQYCLVAVRDDESLVITISFDRQTVIRYSVTPE
ncbi:hypothetical protein [Emcibacter nanhaiensis]|uniref:Uncharacterized protein n=1 Tax=Emcibacter nanhaiensis TaxID=1505037 RepID=A0A501PNX8_9PROT|nr:hypothetical protein [Emcibacter nanhaiensis]TPD61496.1 hypothetical protein FIV46_04625 [Emcibacter nanhaiensis]